MRKTEGFDVFLEARRDDPLVPPELVSLQIRLHRRKELLDLHELRACNLGDRLAVLSPLRHDPVEEEDEFFGEVRYISTGLSMYKKAGEERKGKRRWVELWLDLDQFLSRVLVVIQLRPKCVEQRQYFLFRAQAVSSRAHDER